VNDDMRSGVAPSTLTDIHAFRAVDPSGHNFSRREHRRIYTFRLLGSEVLFERVEARTEGYRVFEPFLAIVMTAAIKS
jgi:hypothetical protein